MIKKEMLIATGELEQMRERLKTTKRTLDEIFIILQDKRKKLQELNIKRKASKDRDRALEEEIKTLAIGVRQDDIRENELLQNRDKLEKHIGLKEHQIYEFGIKKTALSQKKREDMERIKNSDKGEIETKKKYDHIVEATAKALMKKKVKV